MSRGTKFTFYGAMCVLVERSDGKKFLFDPYITKNVQCTTPLENFYDIDYLFVTHNAGDHFGDADVIMQNAEKAVLVSGKDVNRHIQKLVKLPRERWYGTIYGDARKLDDISTLLLSPSASFDMWPSWGKMVMKCPSGTRIRSPLPSG